MLVGFINQLATGGAHSVGPSMGDLVGALPARSLYEDLMRF